MKRVTYFSAWINPQHFVCEPDEVRAMVDEGKAQQFKVVVTDAADDAPTGW